MPRLLSVALPAQSDGPHLLEVLEQNLPWLLQPVPPDLILFQAGAELHLHAARLEPFAVGIRPLGARAGRADIAHVGAAFDQQAGDQQLRALVARDGDAPLDRHR